MDAFKPDSAIKKTERRNEALLEPPCLAPMVEDAEENEAGEASDAVDDMSSSAKKKRSSSTTKEFSADGAIIEIDEEENAAMEVRGGTLCVRGREKGLPYSVWNSTPQ